jgi:hypothetical protein
MPGPGAPAFRAAYPGRVDLAGKLQIKPGTLVAIVAAPDGGPDLTGGLLLTSRADEAGAVIAFAHRLADLDGAAGPAIDAARQDKLAWIAYPKAGQLGTDLSRDALVAAIDSRGIHPVRQISIDGVWSALRFRPAP